MLLNIKKRIRDQDFSELLKGGSISFFLRFLGLFIGYCLTLLIANLFGAKGLGDYVLAIIILRLFVVVSKLGLDTTAIRFIAAFSNQSKWTSVFKFKQQIFLILSITSIIASVLMYSLSAPIADLIHIPASYIRLNSFFILPFSFFILHYQALRGLKRIAEFSFFYRVSQSLFSIISILIIYQFSISQEVPVYAYLVSISIVSILSFFSFRYWLNKMSKGTQGADLEVMSYSSLFKISIPLMFAQSVQFIMAWTDKLMLGAMTTSNDVGVYHTAFKLSMFAAISLMSINSIAAPKFAEMYSKNNMSGLKKVVQQSTKIIFFTTVPLVVIFFVFPEYILSFFGEEFKVGVTAFILLSCGRLISSFAGSVGNLLQMTDNQNIYANILFAGAFLNVFLNLILIPSYGINGAAIASLSSLFVWNFSMVLVVKRKFGFYTIYIPFLRS